LKAIEFVSAHDDDSIFSMQGNALWTTLLGVPHDFTKAGLRILQPPSPRTGSLR
jgi:hypothetical protein